MSNALKKPTEKIVNEKFPLASQLCLGLPYHAIGIRKVTACLIS